MPPESAHRIRTKPITSLWDPAPEFSRTENARQTSFEATGVTHLDLCLAFHAIHGMFRHGADSTA